MNIITKYLRKWRVEARNAATRFLKKLLWKEHLIYVQTNKLVLVQVCLEVYSRKEGLHDQPL